MSSERAPSFIELDTARFVALRELHAFVSRAETLRDEDWRRPTPCVGWTVHDLVEHVAGVPGYDYFAGRLRAARLGDDSGPRTNASTSPTGHLAAELVDILRRGAAEFDTELNLLTNNDLDRELFILPGRTQLLRSALGSYIYEFGLHRYDLEVAFGHQFELAPDVCRGVVLFAETDGFRPLAIDASPWAGARPAPSEDVSYVLRGDTVGWAFSFTASGEPRPFSPVKIGRWDSGAIHQHCCTVKGTDSAVCLVLAGRISTHNDVVTATAGFPPRFFTVW